MTKQLAGQLVREVEIDGVGVAVFATDSTRDLVFASDGVAEELDELQFTVGEGPCLDAYRFHRPERHDDMAGGEALTRWPLFASEALSVGAASLYAYPLHANPLDRMGVPFGVLELYGRSPVALTARDDVMCRSYAHTIAHAVLSELGTAYAVTAGSNVGVFRRGNVHIASGILAAHHGISVDEAMVRLRALAFARQRRITEIARDVISGERFDTGLH
ncbi:GAF and ANTAR domain-containing protein [Rhodococcus qingshengii]|uniref:GAF and ANTAR domain-containing protein n=1 Tax=Rhodococcus qingshengii TaxID=334542 RepID=UPI00301917F0